jgi:plastocyanin
MSRQVWIRVCAAAAASVVLAAAVAFADGGGERFRVRDECDAATFNSGPPTGPGLGNICDPNFGGDETFQEFIAEITATQQAEHWRFQPDRTTVDRGERTTIQSRGGETHTFTRVAKFGGGVVPVLNQLSGAGETVAECGSVATGPLPPSPTNFFVLAGSEGAGPTAGSAALPRGTSRWQCCIHPWMRSTITVR